MKKKIVILGSTGSIGKSLIKILKKNINNFEIVLLTANKNYKELLKQVETLKVKNVIITNFNSYNKFIKENRNRNVKIFSNFKNLNKIIKSKVDYSMSAIIGIDGLSPTFQLIKYSKTIAIANKESIICGWNLIKKQLDKHQTSFIPVDSEHFSIWYGLKNIQTKNIDKIYLTASGGPLLNYPTHKVKNVKLKDVLNHPNWKMGKKITVDSATMMNKVFEIIEAKNIFNINLQKLSILIHPKSYVHAILSLKDGMIKVIAHETTMEIPIINSLYKEKNFFYKTKKLDIKSLNKLELSEVNVKKFPIVKILKKIPQKISLFETILVSANDELVRLYLKKKINYEEIIKKLSLLIKSKEFEKYKKISPTSCDDIIKLDEYVRLKINTKSI